MKLVNFYLLTLLMLFGVLACSPRQETIVEKHFGTPPGTGLPGSPQGPESAGSGGYPPPPSSMGGADVGGGGNGVAGKPLESYQVNITTVPAYQRVREKVINKLAVRFPKLAGDLIHITEERNWYFVPVSMDAIPAFKIGVNFRTDQFANHKLKEIWFDSKHFDDMEEKPQENLILHELLMGVKVLEFTNLLDQCLANISSLRLTSENEEAYKAARKKCFSKNRNAVDIGDSIGLGKSIQLTNDDYDSIRTLTTLLMSSVDTLDAQELEDWMAIRKFRTYPK